MCTSISKGPTLSILQPTPKLRLQFSEQRCYVGCILISCIDKMGPFEMDVHNTVQGNDRYQAKVKIIGSANDVIDGCGRTICLELICSKVNRALIATDEKTIS